MATQPISKPNAVTYPLEDIVEEVLEGHVRIPDFQRKFKWQWEDVRRLFDSIVRGYPIGNLLLWSRPAAAAELELGALSLRAPEVDQALWVVDGQQRLTSLANALNDAGQQDPRFSLAYDLVEGNFVKGNEHRSHVVPLPIIFDLQRLIRWFSEHSESAEYFDEATRVAKAIRQYAIPAYIVKQQDESVLRDIFDRVNNHGRKLTRAEVFSALHAGDGGGGPPVTFADIVEEIDVRRGFGAIDDDTVLHAVLARRGADVTREIRIEFSGERVSREFPNEDVGDAYRHGGAALQSAIEVPETRLVHRDQLSDVPDDFWPSGEELAYAVRRFDRTADRGLVHVEDLAQVRGIYPENKYVGSFETVAALVYRGRDVASLQEFARRLAFIVVIRNGDAHLKNWSLLYENPRSPRLAPAYDLVSTAMYQPPGRLEDLGLKLGKSRHFQAVTLAHFERIQRKLGATHASLADEARGVVERMRTVWPEIAELLRDDPQLLKGIGNELGVRMTALLRT